MRAVCLMTSIGSSRPGVMRLETTAPGSTGYLRLGVVSGGPVEPVRVHDEEVSACEVFDVHVHYGWWDRLGQRDSGKGWLEALAAAAEEAASSRSP